MDLATLTRHSPPRDGSLAQASPGGLSCAPAAELRPVGTVLPGTPETDDPRLAALRRASALLEALEAERQALDERLDAARRIDPMRHVRGATSLDAAVEETRILVRELEELLRNAAESARHAGRTHPKEPQ